MISKLELNYLLIISKLLLYQLTDMVCLGTKVSTATTESIDKKISKFPLLALYRLLVKQNNVFTVIILE